MELNSSLTFSRLCMDNSPNIPAESIAESSSKSDEDDALDPRVQVELERLNHANEAINHLELQLDVIISNRI